MAAVPSAVVDSVVTMEPDICQRAYHVVDQYTQNTQKYNFNGADVSLRSPRYSMGIPNNCENFRSSF